MDEAFESMQEFRKVIAFNRSKGSAQITSTSSSLAAEKSISLNTQKLQLARDTINFAEFIGSQDGYRQNQVGKITWP